MVTPSSLDCLYIFHGRSYQKGWFRAFRGTPILGNLHMVVYYHIYIYPMVFAGGWVSLVTSARVAEQKKSCVDWCAISRKMIPSHEKELVPGTSSIPSGNFT